VAQELVTALRILVFTGQRAHGATAHHILNTQIDDIFVLLVDMLEDDQKQDSNSNFIVIWLYETLGCGVEY